KTAYECFTCREFRRVLFRSKATATKAKVNTNAPEFTKDQDLFAFREMLLIRRFEEKAGQMYGMGLIGGFCHLYIGQEAVVTGIRAEERRVGEGGRARRGVGA